MDWSEILGLILTAVSLLFGGGLLVWAVKKTVSALVLAPCSKPRLSPPIVSTYCNAGYRRLGIAIRNLPYKGRFKRWVRQQTETEVSILFVVLNDAGVVVIGDGLWESDGQVTSIPPSVGRHIHGETMWLFSKRTPGQWVEVHGSINLGMSQIPNGSYTVKVLVRDTQARGWEHQLRLNSLTEALEDFDLVLEHSV